MIYVMSDIHGCYDEYIELLRKINFCDDDDLYILGDVVDRGPEPIKVLQDMMLRSNVYPILGNHDYIALKILKKMNVAITEENVETHLNREDLQDYMYWLQDGGLVTAEKFRKLDKEEKNDILDYLQEFAVYEEVFVNGKHYILAHADLHGFEENKSLDEYALSDFLFYRADYSKSYFENSKKILVTGHTPTFLFRKDGQALIYNECGHLAIDCGCVYGKKLAIYCLDNGTAVYVDKR